MTEFVTKVTADGFHGAATHPGGVVRACGYNAAREILKDGEKPFGRLISGRSPGSS